MQPRVGSGLGRGRCPGTSTAFGQDVCPAQPGLGSGTWVGCCCAGSGYPQGSLWLPCLQSNSFVGKTCAKPFFSLVFHFVFGKQCPKQARARCISWQSSLAALGGQLCPQPLCLPTAPWAEQEPRWAKAGFVCAKREHGKFFKMKNLQVLCCHLQLCCFAILL